MIGRAPHVLAATVVGTIAVFAYRPASTTLDALGPTNASEQVDARGPAPRSVTVDGPQAQTEYGPVAVQVSVDPDSGTVLSATMTEFPTELPKSARINHRAAPQLEARAVGIRSAGDVATVSGATYTSDGFRESLAAAITRALAGAPG